ncbi:manganese efflux pump MntP [Alicyclobacillus tolerans]|uniref:Putative Mn2+ efflux pump MntP n=1 Tax=Alicyclobacillus tolerans TaxID=90970 RepID=A0A1M6T9V5_9BACL|nr:manganese efflux pump [Alicyclobacillus montanus]SHK53757.1 Putative Mn2+ efflux pump MntP [Alicyclobacillus montanus]
MPFSMRDLLNIAMMSIALGMDSFSLSIGMGLNGINRKRAIQMCICIGLFHIVFALLGLWVGFWVEAKVGQIAKGFGAFLLIGLGIHMLFESFHKKRETVRRRGNSLLSLLLFSSGVSIDALSVGFTLGLRSATYGIVSAFAFGVAGAVMTGAGLYLGKKASGWSGWLGELFGSFLLIFLGLRFLFE